VIRTGRPRIGRIRPGPGRTGQLNPYDWHIIRGDPRITRLMGEVGLTKPKARVAGIDAAGRVEAVGANVRGLRRGDEVLGFCRPLPASG